MAVMSNQGDEHHSSEIYQCLDGLDGALCGNMISWCGYLIAIR